MTISSLTHGNDEDDYQEGKISQNRNEKKIVCNVIFPRVSSALTFVMQCGHVII